eukprot:9927334-Alexandrium_andersonii.AAC.1
MTKCARLCGPRPQTEGRSAGLSNPWQSIRNGAEPQPHPASVASDHQHDKSPESQLFHWRRTAAQGA